MKRKARLLILSVAIGTMVFLTGNGLHTLRAEDNPPDKKESKGTDKYIETVWLNDFENCEDWRAVATCPLGDTYIKKYPGKPRPVNELGEEVNENGEKGTFPDTQKDENNENRENKFLLGVKTYYADMGFDRVEILPPNEYIIKGKAKEIKIWVLGRKLRHTLYIKLRDYRGVIHKLKVGRVDFWGWKEMSLIVPGWLPQSSTYALLDKYLHFVSLVVESDKYEGPGNYYIYFDQLRVITDMSEFTGDDAIKDNW